LTTYLNTLFEMADIGVRLHGRNEVAARRLRPQWASLSFLILATCHRKPSAMTTDEHLAKALKARLSELVSRHSEIASELRKPLSADSEEQAADLENQEVLEAIENAEVHEIHEIREALRRMSEGTYGVCAKCGVAIDPKRLKAMPTAARCISCVT
jgi:RNA polymerase-binding protein DksA